MPLPFIHCCCLCSSAQYLTSARCLSAVFQCPILSTRYVSAVFQCPIFDTQRDVVYGNQYQTMTLKAGIENLLRHYIPEVTEVRPVGVEF